MNHMITLKSREFSLIYIHYTSHPFILHCSAKIFKGKLEKYLNSLKTQPFLIPVIYTKETWSVYANGCNHSPCTYTATSSQINP